MLPKSRAGYGWLDKYLTSVFAGGVFMIGNKEQSIQFRDPEIASIEMLRRAFNLPEEQRIGLLKRVYDEELSLVTEALKGHISIPFDYELVSGRLIAADGESFTDMNKKAIKYFKHKSEEDSRYDFMLKRAIYEYQESLKVEELVKYGSALNTMVTISPYPQEAEDKYGKRFLESLGFHTDTKRAMLRAVQKTDTGIKMYTRVVEDSDLSSWLKLLPSHYKTKETDDMLTHTMYFNGNAVNILDDLQEQYESICGLPKQNGGKIDVWLFVRQKQDLVDYFYDQLTELSNTNLCDNELKIKLQKLRWDFWSAIKLSLEKQIEGEKYMDTSSVSEIFSASGTTTQARRDTYISCGMAILPTEQMSTKDMLQEIFGQQEILKCVKCPYCRKTVDAKVKKGTIECLNSSCGAKLDTNSGKRIDKNCKKKSLMDYILDLFFESDNQKK